MFFIHVIMIKSNYCFVINIGVKLHISSFSICIYYFPKYKTDLYKYRYLSTILKTRFITFRAWLLGSAPISYLVPHMTDQSKSGTWMSWHTLKRCAYTISDNIHVDTYLTEKMSLCSMYIKPILLFDVCLELVHFMYRLSSY